MDVPSITSSITTAFQNGFAQLDKAAVELASPESLTAPTDTVELSGTVPGADDPMITGVADLMQAQLQVGAGALLMHAYGADRQRLFDLLNAAGTDRPAA